MAPMIEVTWLVAKAAWLSRVLLTLLAVAASSASATSWSVLDSMPENSWAQLNVNSFLSAAPDPQFRALPFGTYAARPESVIYAWSGFAWDSRRSQLLIYGGGHANYAGNEVYSWNFGTGAWQLASLPSQMAAIPGVNAEANYVPVDGAMNAPPSAHTYDNTVYLPIADRMLVLGGAVFQSGGQYTVQIDSSTSRVTGPYLFDPAKADGTKVGGTSGSGADGLQPNGIAVNSVGGRMWQNRDISVGNFRSLSFVEGTTAVTVEGGHDVVYFSARTGGGTSTNLYRYEIADVQNPAFDQLTQVGTFWNAALNPSGAPNAWGAGAYDPVSRLYVFIGSGSTFGAWDLDNAGLTNPSYGVTPTVTGGAFNMSQMDAIEWDPLRSRWLVWGGGGAIWALKAPAAGTVAGQWTLEKLADSSMFAAGQAPAEFVAQGALGKWDYAPELDAFVALEDSGNGAVWVYKPTAWAAAAIPEPATYLMFFVGLLVLTTVVQGRSAVAAGRR